MQLTHSTSKSPCRSFIGYTQYFLLCLYLPLNLPFQKNSLMSQISLRRSIWSLLLPLLLYLAPNLMDTPISPSERLLFYMRFLRAPSLRAVHYTHTSRVRRIRTTVAVPVP